MIFNTPPPPHNSKIFPMKAEREEIRQSTRAEVEREMDGVLEDFRRHYEEKRLEAVKAVKNERKRRMDVERSLTRAQKTNGELKRALETAVSFGVKQAKSSALSQLVSIMLNDLQFYIFYRRRPTCARHRLRALRHPLLARMDG